MSLSRCEVASLRSQRPCGCGVQNEYVPIVVGHYAFAEATANEGRPTTAVK